MNITRFLTLTVLLSVVAICLWVARDAGEIGGTSAHVSVESSFLTESDNVSMQREIAENSRRMVEAMKRGDLLGVARFYADDATIIFHRGQKLHGRKAVDAYWTSIKGAKDWKLDVIEVGGSRNEVYQIGKSSFTSETNGKEGNYTCDYVAIWKRQKDGTLKIYVDIYN